MDQVDDEQQKTFTKHKVVSKLKSTAPKRMIASHS